ncbi:hypothetical protein DCAR_0727910 [Daucus carota subsp. sativus]|uniref:Uncharacterized protein n=1 Tax=Daucus carota subsp. sativus TaxID=79200 RepID=A0AAF0XKG5_DAUCS|nr:hypothetical protein DCAR_0727910 [Daucus carota subsp. sativus]
MDPEKFSYSVLMEYPKKTVKPQKYIIPEEGKDWIMKTIDESWRVYKSRFKAQYYTKYDTDEDRLKNRPQHISLEQFKSLIAYWGDEFFPKVKSSSFILVLSHNVLSVIS